MGEPKAEKEGTEELVYILKTENKENEIETNFTNDSPRTNKIKKFFKKHADQLVDQTIDASGNVISTGYLSLGLSFKVNKVPRKDISIDPEKFTSENNENERVQNNLWFNYSFAITPILGSTQLLNLFDGLKFPLNLDPVVGASGGSRYHYSMVTPRDIKEFADEKASKKFLNYVKGIVQTYKISIPRNAKHLLNEKKYPSGTELTWKKQNFALFGVGLNIPTEFVSLGVRKYILLEGNLTKKLKIFRVFGKTFVEVELTKEKAKSNESGFDSGFGVNILESSPIGAAVSIRVLTTSKKKVKSNTFKLNYIFDLSYQESISALNEVMNNNFTQAQKYAVDVTQFDLQAIPYKGVLLTENHSMDLMSKIYSLNYGLFNIRFKIKLGAFTLSLNNLIPDIIWSSHQKSESNSEGIYNYPYQFPTKRFSLTLNKDHQLKILNGLWVNKSTGILYNNELIKTTTLQNKEVTYNQVLLQETVSNENTSEKHFNKYYEPNRYILKILKPDISSILYSIEENKGCYEDYKMIKHLIIFPATIKDILSASQVEHYKAFASLFNIPYSPWWLDPKQREIMLKNHFDNFFKKNDRTSTPLYNYILKMYNLFLEMENWEQKRIKRIAQGKKLTNDQEYFKIPHGFSFDNENVKLARLFHEKYAKFFMKQGFIDYLTLLAHNTSSRDYFSGFILNSKKCDIQWINSPQSNINPESLSKEIDSYVQDFWN